MNQEDAKAWKQALARIDALDELISPVLRAINAMVEPERSALTAQIIEIEDRIGEIETCQFCAEPFEADQADHVYADISCCPACGQARRDEMAACDHRFKLVETYDGPGLDCTLCACQILEEDAERFLGPERYAVFQAGGMRAEAPARCSKCGYTAGDAAQHMDHSLCDGEIPAASPTQQQMGE